MGLGKRLAKSTATALPDCFAVPRIVTRHGSVGVRRGMPSLPLPLAGDRVPASPPRSLIA